MDRAVIVGCGGSGKSTFARRLGELLGAPVTHLDALYYDRDWKPMSGDRFATLQHELVTSPSWVIDGNYASTLPIRLARADTVVFLDLSAAVCLRGIARRRLHRVLRDRTGRQNAQTGMYDRITWEFVRYVWNYRQSMAPRVRELIAEHAGDAQVHVVRSRRAADVLLTHIAVQASRCP